MYSQNNEEQVIYDYFANKTKSIHHILLDIGANDGRTFSNSLRLIELGWYAVLVEPSERAQQALQALHGHNPRVHLIKAAIGLETGTATLHESGHHLPDKSDHALLSSLKPEETERWRRARVEFTDVEVDVITYQELLQRCGYTGFDFITIDAEGMDLEILVQIDLSHTGLLCIEWNSNHEVREQVLNYCQHYGLTKVLYTNAENLIIGR